MSKFELGTFVAILPDVKMAWGNTVSNWHGQVLETMDGYAFIRLDADSIRTFDKDYLVFSFFNAPSWEYLVVSEDYLVPATQRSTEEEEEEAFAEIEPTVEAAEEAAMELYEDFKENTLEDFKESIPFLQLDKEQQSQAELIIFTFLQWGIDYFGTPIMQWNDDVLTELLLTILPNVEIEDESYVQNAVPVFSAYIEFLGKEGVLPFAEEMLKDIKEIEELLPMAINNPGAMMMTRELTEAIIEAGIDITDESAAVRFIEDYINAIDEEE